MNEKGKLFLSFIIVAMLIGIAANSQVVGPQGIYDFAWLNGTSLNVGSVYINSVNYTEQIITGGGGESGDNFVWENGTNPLTGNWDAQQGINVTYMDAEDYYQDGENYTQRILDAAASGALSDVNYTTKFTVIELDGSYYTYDEDGTEIYSGSNATIAASFAFDNMTTNRGQFETVKFRGNFTVGINSYFQPQSYEWTDIDGYGATWIKDYPGADTPIFYAEEVSRLRIRGVYLNGSKALGVGNNNAGASGIVVDNNDVIMIPGGPTVELIDIDADEFYDDCVSIDISASNQIKITRTRATGTTRRAFELHGGDSYLENSNAGSYYENLHWTGGRLNVDNFYAGGTCQGADCAIYINGHRSILTNINVDYCFEQGIIIENVNNGIIDTVNFVMKNNTGDDLGNTYDAIQLINSKNWTISGSRTSQYTGDTWKYRHGVNESGTSDFNTIYGCDFTDVGTSPYNLIGENSKADFPPQIILMGRATGVAGVVDSTRYVIPGGDLDALSSSIANAKMFIPYSGTLRNLRVYGLAGTEVSNVTASINETPSALQAILTAGGGSKWYNDTTNVISVSAGDTFSFVIVYGNTASNLKCIMVEYFYHDSQW